MSLRGLCVMATAATLAMAGTATASDGAYGRFEGDLELDVGAGAAVSGGGLSATARAVALYLSIAGVYARGAAAFDDDARGAGRSFGGGVAVRPLFLGRYAQDLERGPARLDLFVDSIGVELGTFWSAPGGGSFASEPGLELGLALAVPLLEDASGPFVGFTGALRWRDVDLRGAGAGDGIDRGAFFALTLEWRQIVAAHIVDVGDRAAR